MSADTTFRAALIVGLIVVLPFALYHRLKSQATHEPLDRRQEGVFILATLRPVGLLFWLGLIAYMVKPGSMAWSSAMLPVSLRWAGTGVSVVAAALLFWTFRSLGPNLTDTVVTRRAHTLITDGPYRWVRHPFYDSMALLILGTSLMTANWFLLLTGCVAFGLIVIRTRTEEAHLLARFGDAYRMYLTQTGRFVPKRGGVSRGGGVV
jgi:protein-S-isoprenylcysteine O-methyltransferase Ste14